MEYRSHKGRHSRREPLSMTELCDVFKKRNDEIFLRNSEHSRQPSTSSKPPETGRFEKERNRSVGIYVVNEMQKRLDCNSSQELPEGKRVNLMKQEISQYQRNVKRGMSQNEVQRKIPENLQGLPHEQKHEERQNVIHGRMLSPIVDVIPQNQRYSVKETPQIEGQKERGPKEEKANEERKKSEGRRVSQIAQEMPKQQRLVVNCPKQSQHHKKEPSRRIRKSNKFQASAKKEMSQDEWKRMTTPAPSKTLQKEGRPKEQFAEKTTQGSTSEKHHWMPKEKMFKKAKEFNEIARKLSQRFDQQDEKERIGLSFQEEGDQRSNAKVMVVIDDEKQSVEFFIEM